MSLNDAVDFLGSLAAQLDFEASVIADSSQAERFISYSRSALRIRNDIDKYLDDLTAKRGRAIQLTPDDVDDLPDELRAELSQSDAEQFELDILRLVEQAGGMISLDVLLVQWYRTKNEVVKRRTMTARIYRMLSKERLFSTPGYKGVYQLSRPVEEDPIERDDLSSVETQIEGFEDLSDDEVSFL